MNKMNKRTILFGVAVVLPMLVLAAALGGVAVAQGPAPQGDAGIVDPQSVVGAQAVLGSGFTYQGQLVQGGSPVSGTCTFDFGLWNAGAAAASSPSPGRWRSA